MDPDTDKVVHHEASGVKQYVPLDIKATPSTMTFGVHDDQLLCDPCQQEAVKLTSSVQVTVAGHGHCSGAPWSYEQCMLISMISGSLPVKYNNVGDRTVSKCMTLDLPSYRHRLAGIELQCKSNVSQALLKGAIQSAYTRNSAIQAMFA